MGSGAFGVCKLMEDVTTGERVAVKLMERGPKVPLLAAQRRIPKDTVWEL